MLRRNVVKVLILGATGLAYTGYSAAILAVGRTIGFVDQVSPQASPVPLPDFQVSELAEDDKLAQMGDRTITVAGWPQFVLRHQIENLMPDSSPFKIDLYRLFEEAYEQGPFIYFTKTDPNIPLDRNIAGTMYKDRKVVVEGVTSGPLKGRKLLIPTYLLAREDPVIIASVPPREL